MTWRARSGRHYRLPRALLRAVQTVVVLRTQFRPAGGSRITKHSAEMTFRVRIRSYRRAAAAAEEEEEHRGEHARGGGTRRRSAYFKNPPACAAAHPASAAASSSAGLLQRVLTAWPMPCVVPRPPRDLADANPARVRTTARRGVAPPSRLK